MKLANILFRALQVFLSFMLFLVFVAAILIIHNDSVHYYDHLLDDQKKISYISDCYLNNLPINSDYSDYQIDLKKNKIIFRSNTCKITYSIDKNGTIQDNQEYTLIEKPHILYVVSYIFLISLWIWIHNLIYSIDDSSQSDKTSTT